MSLFLNVQLNGLNVTYNVYQLILLTVLFFWTNKVAYTVYDKWFLGDNSADIK